PGATYQRRVVGLRGRACTLCSALRPRGRPSTISLAHDMRVSITRVNSSTVFACAEADICRYLETLRTSQPGSTEPVASWAARNARWLPSQNGGTFVALHPQNATMRSCGAV